MKCSEARDVTTTHLIALTENPNFGIEQNVICQQNCTITSLVSVVFLNINSSTSLQQARDTIIIRPESDMLKICPKSFRNFPIFHLSYSFSVSPLNDCNYSVLI